MTENHNSGVDELMSELERERPQKFSSWEITNFTSKFQFKLGFGAFGDVYKGEFPDRRQVAVKVLKNNTMDVMEKQFISEVGTMGRTFHENLIKLYGYCFDVDMKALVYEYMEKGSLESILYDPHIKWVDLYKIAIKIARGLSFLHSCRPQIIHHDVKPANVLLDSKFCPKITDFGLAKLNKDLSHFAQTGYRGTPGYAAPEVSMNHRSITCKCDVYSFGILLFDILGRKKYSEGEEWFPPQVWKHFKNGELDKIIMECGIGEEDKEDAEILSKVALLCAQFDAQDRPSMSTVVTMLKGEIPPGTPKDNPFPLYVSSSDSRIKRARHGSIRMVSPAYDERQHRNVRVSSHGSSSSSESREPKLKQGVFLNTPIVLDQRNMNQIQNHECLGNGRKADKEIVSSGDFDAFVSRESTTKKIVEALEDGKIGLIGVFGMPGVGKTMLLDAIYNKVKKERMFDKVVMVTVSQNPVLEKIQDNIARRLDLRFDDKDDSGIKKDKLNDKINQSKKTLIVLDDVWERLEIVEVGIPHKNINKDCTVIFTTRFRGVCGTMESDVSIEVTTLTPEESWQLFRKRAAYAPPHNSILPGVAKDIAKECKGLPLAIATLGRALRDKGENVWNCALRLLRKSIFDGMSPVFSSIKMSYDFLGSEEMKMCFLFCCLYPEDYEIDTNNIFCYVMGEKLLRNADTFIDARSIFDLIIEELVSSSLLLRKDESCVMLHDVVRDVAIKIASSAESNKFIVKAGMNLTEWPDMELGNCNRLSLISNKITWFPPYQIKAPNLLTLCLNKNFGIQEIPSNFFEGMQNLTTLDLSDTSVKSLPPSFSLLRSLRVLCMDKCWNLDDISQIEWLDRLEILSFYDCKWIQSWEPLGKLTTLKMLNLIDTSFIGFLRKEIWYLHRLEELCMTLSTDERYSQEVLPSNWGNLTEFIFVCKSNNSINLTKRSCNLKKKMYLELLSNSVPNWIPVLSSWTNGLFLRRCKYLKSVDQLDPSGMFDNLKLLDIYECKSMTHLYSTASSCEAMAPMYAFRNLERLELYEVNELVALCDGTLPQGFFQNLKFLEVGMCKVIIMIPCDLLERLQNLEKLEVVDCYDMKKLVQLTSNATQSMSSSGPSFPIFPNLRKLDIWGCSKLKYLLPMRVLRELRQLEKLLIYWSKNMVMIVEHENYEVVDVDQDKAILPRLKSLDLSWNRQLMSFCSSSLLFDWPALEYLKVIDCSKLKRLPLHTNSAPKLITLEVDLKRGQQWFDGLEWEDESLKSRLQPLILKVEESESESEEEESESEEQLEESEED